MHHRLAQRKCDRKYTAYQLWLSEPSHGTLARASTARWLGYGYMRFRSHAVELEGRKCYAYAHHGSYRPLDS